MKTKTKNIGRFFIILVSIMLVSAILSSCNQTVFDTAWKFDKAILTIGDETKTIDISSWTDFDGSDCVQFTAKDGTVYLTHYSNVILIKEAG